MKPKYFPPESSILYEDGTHLFDGKDSSYWVIINRDNWLSEPIYRCFELEYWKALYCKIIVSGKADIDHIPFFSVGELQYIEEYKKALDRYKKYLMLF